MNHKYIRTAILASMILFCCATVHAQWIATLAGNGTTGYSGDGGPATAAQLNSPVGVAVDRGNNVYIADDFNHCIRKVVPSGLIYTICGNGMGISKVEKPTIPTEPMPNPSANEVKITFTLPQGVSQGELDLFDGSGKKIKSYQVDDRFGFIMLDNSQLTPGMYYYNIVANGQVSSTQKLVLMK
jgi:hypothetical protein